MCIRDSVTTYNTSQTFLDLIASFESCVDCEILELKFELLAQEESGNKIIVEAEPE